MRLAHLVLALMFLVAVTAVGTVYAQEVTPPRGQLTGKHASLDCGMCHQTGVWHNTYKDVKVCQKCHQDQWNTVTKQSMHMALMRNGTIDREGGSFQVKYCTTCHDPHHNDYLRITAKDGKETYYKFDDIMPLCLNCHSLSDGSRPISNTDVMPQNTTTTKTTTTTTTTMGNITTTTRTSTNQTSVTTTTTKTKQTTLSLVPSALATTVSSPLVLNGQIDPSVAGAEVAIKVKSEGNTTWNILGNVATDADGKYEVTWTPSSAGNFVLMASSGRVESDVYTVKVSEGTGTGSSSLLGLSISPLFLGAILAAVAVAVVAALVFVRKRKKA
ncbi:MAG: hypothetical protein M1503_06375 [Thaumarchaeota archaeon]|nr:hypothetical protein [Nitrososphaerota archaeon]MCL5317869.1 hypothetical protein [Nitrososphaerota archaeon]